MVGVTGTASSPGQSSNPSSDPTARVTRKWIGCGQPAVVEALGDLSTAANNGAICGRAAVEACRAEAAASGVPHAVAVLLVLQRDGTWTYGGSDCVATGPPQVTAAMVRDRITRLVPGAAVGVAPQGRTLVNIETVLWVNAPRSRALSPLTILGRQVTVALSLDHVDWIFGDGTTGAATSAGKAYDDASDPCRTALCADYFGHVYRDTGAVTVSATVSWVASFRVDGGDGVRIPGTVSGPTGRAELTVQQARGVLVPDPGSR